jgi:hypothetical protein
MMFIESGWPNIIQALDLSDPDHPVQVWNYTKTSGRDESAVPRACCDTVNRGMSYADGKLVFGTLDGYVIALDAATGKEDLGGQARLSGPRRNHHTGTDHRQRQGDHRLRRRRVRGARPCDGLQPRRRQEGVGVSTPPAATRMCA